MTGSKITYSNNENYSHLGFKASVLTIFALAMLLCMGTSAQTAGLEDGVLIDRLDNGMDVVLVPNHSVPVIAANIIIKAGARDETWETWGAAHFLEHLLFNGTVNRSQKELYDEFDRMGIYHNAHTGSHFTDFMLLAPSKNFISGLQIMAEMVFRSTLPAWKFEKERGIVMEEIARYQTYGFDSDIPFRQWLFGSESLARDVLGTVESIARLDRDSVITFYHDWYIPNNMMLFVTGDFRSDTLFNSLDDLLSQYRPRTIPHRNRIELPDFNSLAAGGLVVRRGDDKQLELVAAMSAPQPGSPDFPAFMVLTDVLERRFDDDLPAEVRSGTELILDPDLAIFKIRLSAPAGGIDGEILYKSLGKILDGLFRRPPNRTEISRLALRYKADQIFTSEKLHYYGIMNAGYWALVPWQEYYSWRDRIACLQPSDLSVTAKQWIVLKPAAMVFEPVKETPADEITLDSERKIEQFKPENGPTIIIRTDPTAQVFAMHVLVRNRWLWDSFYGTGAVDLLHRLMIEDDRKGDASLGSRLDDLAANLKTCDSPMIPYDNYYTNPDYSFIRLEILPERWKEGIALVVDLMANLPRSESSITAARQGVARASSMSKRNPAGAGKDELRKKLFTLSEMSASVYGDVSGISFKDVEKLRSGYFNPGNLIVTISSPVETDVLSAINDEFAKLSKGDFSPPPQTSEDIIKSDAFSPGVPDSVHLGQVQGAVVFGKIIEKVDVKDQVALIVANAYFNERMGAVLREQRGLAYSLGSSVDMRRISDDDIWAYWEISIGTRPANLSAAENGIRELLSELPEQEFTDSEVERLSNAIIGRLLMRDMPRIGQAYAMGVGEFYWNDPERRAWIVRELKKLTGNEVSSAAREYLKAEGFHVMIVD